MSSDISRLRSGVGTSREEVNRILNALQELSPKSERDATKEYIAFAPTMRLRTTSVTTGGPNVSDTDTRTRQASTTIRKIPATVKSYPLIHATTGTISWQAAGHKLGGNGIFSGSAYITVSDQARLNATDQITIAMWIKPAAASSDGLLLSKSGQYQLKLVNGNKIQFRVNTGSWQTPLEHTYTPGTWIHVAASYKSTSSGQKLYINGALSSSDAVTGSLATTANDLKIGGDGTSNVPANTAMSWLTFLHKEVSSSWITDLHSNNILDHSGTNEEIMTISFVGDESPKPVATSGLCRST